MTSEKPIEDFDHHSPDFAKDWRTRLDAMRERGPVWTNAHDGYWVVTRHEDIMRIENDWETFSCENDVDGTQRGGRGINIPQNPYRFWLNESDPPEHSKLRKLEIPFFTPAAIERWRPAIQGHIDEQIDAVIETGRIDLCHELAIPIPAKVSLQVAGFDIDHWEEFALTSYKAAYLPSTAPDYPHEGRARVREKIRQIMDDARAAPETDTVVSRLAHAEVDGEKIPEAAAEAMIAALVFAAFDTTGSLILNSLFWLNQHPDECARLAGDDKLLDNAVAEFLRAFPPVQGMGRNVMKDVELGGQLMRKGERVLMSFAGGNLDPEKFACPHEVRIDRENARQHLAFGAGPHRCLGAQLAQAEAKMVLKSVMSRLKDLKIDTSEAERFPTYGRILGWFKMPATFAPGPKLGREPA